MRLLFFIVDGGFRAIPIQAIQPGPQIGGMSLINAAGAQINAGGIKKSHEHARPVYLSRSLRQLHFAVRVDAFHS